METSSHRPLVLFLCTGNSARSQMAEAILRSKASARFDAASAGMEPKSLNPLTVNVLEEIGLCTDDLQSKPSSQFLGKVAVRYAVIVCERTNQSCPSIHPFAAQTLYWPFEDPATFEGTEAERLAKFRAARDQIASRIEARLNALSSGLA